MARKYRYLSVGQDAKTVKGEAQEYKTAILYLAPARVADGVHTMCSKSTIECENVCVYKTGRGRFSNVQLARINRTLAYIASPTQFLLDLKIDVCKFVLECKRKGYKPCVRVNGTSDQPTLALQLAESFPEVQFYDYTKIDRPWERVRHNYHLTFSYSGDDSSLMAGAALVNGINVAVVFTGGLPDTWRGKKVIDGDKNDLRFLDPKGVIVGLTAKGPAKKATVGQFIQIGGVK